MGNIESPYKCNKKPATKLGTIKLDNDVIDK